MGHSGTGQKFSFNTELYIFKTLFVQSFKKHDKNTYFGPKFKFYHIFKFVILTFEIRKNQKGKN